MLEVPCLGWWEQDFFGQQPMEQLQMKFEDGLVSGTGFDVVGNFEFTGSMQGGEIAMVKQYLGRHQVIYAGCYDGEGAFHGDWRAGACKGRWAISMLPRSESNEIREWHPPQ